MKGSYYTNMELQQLNIIQSVIDRKRTGKEAAKNERKLLHKYGITTTKYHSICHR